MEDYYKNAILLLIKSNYDIFLPLQKPLGDELVISDGNCLQRCLIKKVSTTQQGPMLSAAITHNTMKLIVDSLSIDMIVASWPLNTDAWLIPVSAIAGMQSVRLANRPDWLLSSVRRIDSTTRIDMDPAVAQQIKDQALTEKATRKDGDEERQYYDNILHDKDEL